MRLLQPVIVARAVAFCLSHDIRNAAIPARVKWPGSPVPIPIRVSCFILPKGALSQRPPFPTHDAVRDPVQSRHSHQFGIRSGRMVTMPGKNHRIDSPTTWINTKGKIPQ